MVNYKIIYTSFVIFALILSTANCDNNVGCALVGENGYFEISNMAAPEKNGKKFYTATGGYMFNLCTPVVPDCKAKPDEVDKSYAVRKEADGSCTTLIKKEDKITLKDAGNSLSIILINR